MEKDKTIEVLNTLIEINNDRIEGYETASKETEEHELKAMFVQFAKTSTKCKQELVKEVIELGGIPMEGTRITGKFFRVWMDFKAAITRKDRELILDSCVYGEEAALDTYIQALTEERENTTLEQHQMIKAHLTAIKDDQHKLKSMQNMHVEND